MGSESNTPVGVAGGSADLQRTVDELERMLRELRATQRTIRRRTTIGILAIILVAGGFVLAAYASIRDNFAPERLQKAVSDRVRLLVPQLEAPMRATLENVTPYYIAMGRDRLQRIAPKLDAKVQSEADKLGKDLEKDMNAQLDIFFAKLGKKASAALAGNFPALTGDGGDKANAKILQIMTDEALAFHNQAEAIYQAKAKKVSETLGKFPVPDVTKTDLDTLNRQLLHDLLMLADFEITAHANGAMVAKAEAK